MNENGLREATDAITRRLWKMNDKCISKFGIEPSAADNMYQRERDHDRERFSDPWRFYALKVALIHHYGWPPSELNKLDLPALEIAAASLFTSSDKDG